MLVLSASAQWECRPGSLGVRRLGVKVETTTAEDLQAKSAGFGVPVANGAATVGAKLGAEAAALVSVVIKDAAVYRGSMDLHHCAIPLYAIRHCLSVVPEQPIHRTGSRFRHYFAGFVTMDCLLSGGGTTVPAGRTFCQRWMVLRLLSEPV